MNTACCPDDARAPRNQLCRDHSHRYGCGPALLRHGLRLAVHRLCAGLRWHQAPEGDGEVGGLSLGQNVEPGGPLVLLYSDDLDATVAAVKDAGGTIADEPYASPGGRRFTFFDPSGNRLGVWSTT